ncbi:MAG: flagellar protein FlaG [Dethiobacter sp.]|jgi:flagellar protein FlaG|nr:MAG: flagellar protein FlaG [Dethiobacter sp.]
MKIDGTDPLTLNKIQDQVRRPEVQRLGDIESGNKIIDKQQTGVKDVPRSYKSYIEELEQAVRQANETAEALNLGIRFKFHDSSERLMVQIVNRADNEVIKEIPPERILNLVGQIQEMIGLLLDEKR